MKKNRVQRKEFSHSEMRAQAWDPKNQRPEMWKLIQH